METQLKQRLTGAILLVIIAVLVVPELLTGPKSAAPAAPVANDAAPIRSYTIDLTGATPPRVTRQAGDETPAASTAPAASSAPAAASSPKPAPAGAPPAAASSVGPPQAPAALAAAGAAAPRSQAATAAPPAMAPSATAAPAAAAQPALPPAVHAATLAVAQGFAVQLGSYANRDTVAKLTKALRAAGFKVSVAQVRAGGKELQRVRVGPVADRAAAEALQAKLAAAGHKGPIVPFP